jgi:hypothetical protein
MNVDVIVDPVASFRCAGEAHPRIQASAPERSGNYLALAPDTE